MLSTFYNDGLKDCSWIPDTFQEFEKLTKSSKIIIYKQSVLCIIITNGNILYLDTIYTLKKHRGKGLATKLMNELTANSRVILFCNPKIEDFYRSLGFKSANELPYSIMVN